MSSIYMEHFKQHIVRSVKRDMDLQYMIDHEVPRCEKCNFILNPDVVLYGDTLPQYQKMRSNVYMKQMCLSLWERH